MKLRNRKTGEIIETDYKLFISIPNDETVYGCKTYDELKAYNSLAELNSDWEDVPEEPDKKHWYMTSWGEVWQYGDDPLHMEWRQLLGNDFETKEEAEKAVEKLRAYKRLKDKGFKFTKQISKFNEEKDRWHFLISAECKEWNGNIEADLDLLFGGEE